MGHCRMEHVWTYVTRTTARREGRTAAARRAVWFTTGAADCVAPVRAVKAQLWTVHVRVNVSRRDSMYEMNRDGDQGMR